MRSLRTAQALYDAVVARYSSPATAALGRLLLPYLFPELSAFATVEELVSHLRTSDARYRAAAPPEFLDKNQPPMFITLYFIVTRLPDSLRSVRDHFLSLGLIVLTVDLLEQHLLAAETSVVTVGAARGTLRTPFFEGMSGLLLLVRSAVAARARVAGVVVVAVGVVVGAAMEVVEEVEAVAVVGVVAGVGALVESAVAAVGMAVVAAVGVVAVGLELLSVEVREVASGSSSSVGARPRRLSSFVSGFLSVGHLREAHIQHRCFSRLDDAWRAEFGDKAERPRWAELLRAEDDCYLCVPPDPGIEAAALGATESFLPGTAPAEALHTFTLDSGASRCFFRDSTTLTPLSAQVPVRLADPSRGPVLAHSSTMLPCPAVPSGSLSGLHLPSFSMNLVSTAALQDAMVTTTAPRGQRVSIYTCTRTGRHLATFTRRPGSSLYTLATEPPQVAASAQVSASGQVAPPCSSRLVSHRTLLWHHRLGRPSLPRLRGMHSHLLVYGLPRSLPPLPPSPALPCLPCVQGRQRAAPHSSSFSLTSAPFQTLHMDVWGPARVSGQGRKRYFLLVVDYYMRYTPAFPLRSKGRVVDVLIPWIRAVHLQLRERFCQNLPVLCLHSDRVYGLRHAPRKWHDTLRTTLAALGFAPATADPSLFLRTDTSLPPFYVLVSSVLRLPVLLLTAHSCVYWSIALYSTFGRVRMGLVLGGRGAVVLTGHADASWVDDSATQRSSQGYTFNLGSGSVSWRSTRSSSVLSSSCEAEIYAGAMAAQELRWLTYLLIDLGEQPCSPLVLYVDNKAMIALCQEHRLEHRTKHIALRYFLARELQQRGQLRLAYVATRANTTDIFTKALPPACFAFLIGLVTTCSPPFCLWGFCGQRTTTDTGQITRDRATRTISPTQSHVVQQVLQWFEITSPHSLQPTPVPVPDEPLSLIVATQTLWVASCT
ncbi:unnamed protein product [Closterium sp. NIES-53]